MLYTSRGIRAAGSHGECFTRAVGLGQRVATVSALHEPWVFVSVVSPNPEKNQASGDNQFESGKK